MTAVLTTVLIIYFFHYGACAADYKSTLPIGNVIVEPLYMLNFE